MTWHSPQTLFWIFALPALAALFVWALARRARLLRRFAMAPTLGRVLRGVSLERAIWKRGLIVAAFAALIVALARPQFGETTIELPRQTLDILVAIDVSNSMLASDLEPNRLERARELLDNLIARVENDLGDRVGIVAFAGSAFVDCPLTVDYDWARRILAAAHPDRMQGQGTMLGEAIRASVAAFEQADSQGDRVLVLLTDGEDQGSAPLAAAREAADANTRIYTIGIGSEDGAPIEIDGSFKEDAQGNTVVTQLDFATLSDIALETGGKAIRDTGAGFQEIDPIIGDIRSLRRAARDNETMTIFLERFQWPLALAIGLLVAEMLIGDRRRETSVWKGRFR